MGVVVVGGGVIIVSTLKTFKVNDDDETLPSPINRDFTIRTYVPMFAKVVVYTVINVFELLKIMKPGNPERLDSVTEVIVKIEFVQVVAENIPLRSIYIEAVLNI